MQRAIRRGIVTADCGLVVHETVAANPHHCSVLVTGDTTYIQWLFIGAIIIAFIWTLVELILAWLVCGWLAYPRESQRRALDLQDVFISINRGSTGQNMEESNSDILATHGCLHQLIID